MKVIIIEDEWLTAQDLAEILQRIKPEIKIMAQLQSVGESVDYFLKKETIDLIFSDIQLGDGLSFEIFKQIAVKTPVIFCTAYDEYALEAFKANGIDYILKPYSEQNIRHALQRYENLKTEFIPKENDFSALLEHIYPSTHSAILVYHKEKIIPLKVENIALGYIHNEIVYLYTFDREKYVVNKSLDELSEFLGPTFFRANRQYLLNRKAISDLSVSLTRKFSINLNIPFKETIVVSKDKMNVFLEWLQNN